MNTLNYENETVEYVAPEVSVSKTGIYSIEPFSSSPGGLMPSSATPIGVRKTGIAIKSLIAGESISTGETVMIGDGSNYDIIDTLQVQDNNQNFGNSSLLPTIEQTFTVPKNSSFRYAVVQLKVFGAPTDNVTAYLKQTQGGAILATATFSGTGLTTSYQAISLDFGNSHLRINSGTTYRIEFNRSGVVDASNYYLVAIQNVGSYANGQISTYNGSSWTGQPYDALMQIRKVLVTDSAFLGTSDTSGHANLYIGIAPKNFVTGARIEPAFEGYISGLTGLTQGSTYYLQDNHGAIGTSAGTVSRVVGKAYSTTEFYAISTT